MGITKKDLERVYDKVLKSGKIYKSLYIVAPDEYDAMLNYFKINPDASLEQFYEYYFSISDE